ncbi:MAG: hypothetical protein K8R40_09720 [Anaerolineaceae bacterium]|nr:hypothetical protein [Anaerolineaceae bacterium]
MNSDTELLFPLRLIPELRDLRGSEWQELIDRILSDQSPIEEELGFVLLMVELCSCTSCNSYSFRAIRGCTTCATSTILRFRDTDQELIKRFKKNTEEMAAFMSSKKVERTK